MSATPLIRSLAWEFLYVTGVTLKRKKRKKEEEERKPLIFSELYYLNHEIGTIIFTSKRSS